MSRPTHQHCAPWYAACAAAGTCRGPLVVPMRRQPFKSTSCVYCCRPGGLRCFHVCFHMAAALSSPCASHSRPQHPAWSAHDVRHAAHLNSSHQHLRIAPSTRRWLLVLLFCCCCESQDATYVVWRHAQAQALCSDASPAKFLLLQTFFEARSTLASCLQWG